MSLVNSVQHSLCLVYSFPSHVFNLCLVINVNADLSDIVTLLHLFPLGPDEHE